SSDLVGKAARYPATYGESDFREATMLTFLRGYLGAVVERDAPDAEQVEVLRGVVDALTEIAGRETEIARAEVAAPVDVVDAARAADADAEESMWESGCGP
ncbi:MAG: hypothetical protein QG597_1236, partial [Actinomycetota bacterium]|nr:hypothetical protein [Actinomycetota bacterium]